MSTTDEHPAIKDAKLHVKIMAALDEMDVDFLPLNRAQRSRLRAICWRLGVTLEKLDGGKLKFTLPNTGMTITLGEIKTEVVTVQ